MRTVIPIAALTLIVGGLLGCSAPSRDTPPVAEPDPVAEAPCVVGEWSLDVADYAAQSEAYLLGLGIPIVGFGMTGSGTIAFTADGLVATDIDLTSTGTIVAGDTSVPVNEPGRYTASGEWSQPDDPTTIDLANWATVSDPSVETSPGAPQTPAIDYTDVPFVTAECTAGSLLLHVPGAPLSTLWQR